MKGREMKQSGSRLCISSITIFLSAFMIFTSCGKQEEPLENLELLNQYTRAKNYYIDGDIEKARELFLLLKDRAPGFIQALFMLGKCYFFGKEYAKAEEEWKSILQYNPQHLDSRKWLSRLLLMEGRGEEAEIILNESLHYTTEDPQIFLLLGKVKKAKREYSEAIEYYNKASLLISNLVEVYIDLAEIYREFGLREKTDYELSRALSLLDRDSPLYAPLLSLLRNSGEREQGKNQKPEGDLK